VIYYKTCNEFGLRIAAAAVEEIVATQNFTRKKICCSSKEWISEAHAPVSNLQLL
jgi:hypothetical protein